MRYYHGILLATAFAATSTFAATEDNSPIIFKANLDRAQVTHPLEAAKDAHHAPHPFYKTFCKGKSAMPYKDASGEAVVMYNPKTNRVWYALAYRNLSGAPIMMHFHIGKIGKGGPIYQTICGRPPKGSKALGYSAGKAGTGYVCPAKRYGHVVGSFKIKPNKHVKATDTVADVKQALMDGQLYINIHTCLNEPGEIRGQVIR